MASLAATRAAKDSLKRYLGRQPWLRGIGIAQSKCMGPDPYELQVNVGSYADLRALLDCPQTPKSWMGVPIQFVNVGSIRALGADPAIGKQDLANVLMGAMCVTATFFVGKIAVESIIAARKEHFDAKGQPPAATKSKETTLDGLFKLVAFTLSANEIVTGVPALVTEAKKYLP